MFTINLFTYNLLRDNNFKKEDYVKYLTDWQKYESMATKAEAEELHIKCNISWKNVKHIYIHTYIHKSTMKQKVESY